MPPAFNVLAGLLSLRLANALVLATFFQPDEYFQSLEPAWQLAFGPDSGAWLTWEWKAELRSSLHPALFAAAYKAAESVASWFHLGAATRAELLIAAPKICQACVAALGDYYTWRLAGVAYGPGSRPAIATLALTALSPWQWFCSARTLSNSLESTLTVAALCFWPWAQLRATEPHHPQGTSASAIGSISRGDHASARPSSAADPIRHEREPSPPDVWPSLLLAATACILRPTNLLIWLAVGTHALLNAPSWAHRGTWFRQALICGSSALGLAALSDRLYYGVWTLPLLNFLHFNIARDIAVFYGRNRADYYLTEGLPLLLTTAAPFALYGLFHALRRQPAGRSPRAVEQHGRGRDRLAGGDDTPYAGSAMLALFAWTIAVVVAVMSLVAHKEVRFLYPLLPLLHVLSGGPLAEFFARPLNVGRRAALGVALALNIALAVYTTRYHQRGVVDVMHALRGAALRHPTRNVTAAFLMPCHSTPWRSHLVAPNLHAWALTCEPPLDVPPADRAGYLDEADRFYADPAAWLAGNMVATTAGAPAVRGTGPSGDVDASSSGRREWPEYLVFFAALERVLQSEGVGPTGRSGYQDFWRGFNSHWHDDWRRQGDVIVWRRAVD